MIQMLIHQNHSLKIEKLLTQKKEAWLRFVLEKKNIELRLKFYSLNLRGELEFIM